jgi:hypothetical protein
MLDLRFGGPDVDSYRAYRLPWRGFPVDRPAVAVRSGPNGRVLVSASWNGSTEVTRWSVLAGADPATLRPVTAVGKSGFETTIAVASKAQYFAVDAIDENGRVLRRSEAVRRSG